MKKQQYTVSTCVCPNCGLRFPIPRKKSKARESKHQKHIWCPHCKEVHNFTEYRFNDFMIREGEES